MTKRAVIVGLVMAVVVLILVFIMYSPEKTQAPTIYEQEPQTRTNNEQTTPTTSNNNDTSDDIDADLKALDSDLNSIDSEFDTSGL